MSLEERKQQVLSEPAGDGIPYLKPDQVKVGDRVKVEKVEIQPLTIYEERTIPAKPVVTGVFLAAGSSVEAQTVKVGISKSTEKKLFMLWDVNWVGRYLMVTSIQSKVIEGAKRTWIEWVGLP